MKKILFAFFRVWFRLYEFFSHKGTTEFIAQNLLRTTTNKHAIMLLASKAGIDPAWLFDTAFNLAREENRMERQALEAKMKDYNNNGGN